MRIEAEDFNGRDVRVSLEAETAAEFYYLQRLADSLEKHSADWQEFDDMEGRRGITLIVQKKSHV